MLSELFDWKPVCPEAGISRGVPRPPMQLITGDGLTPALGVEDAGIKVTDALTACAYELKGALQDPLSGVLRSCSGKGW